MSEQLTLRDRLRGVADGTHTVQTPKGRRRLNVSRNHHDAVVLTTSTGTWIGAVASNGRGDLRGRYCTWLQALAEHVGGCACPS